MSTTNKPTQKTTLTIGEMVFEIGLNQIQEAAKIVAFLQSLPAYKTDYVGHLTCFEENLPSSMLVPTELQAQIAHGRAFILTEQLRTELEAAAQARKEARK